MKHFKKAIAALVLTAMLGTSSNTLRADECCPPANDCCYVDDCSGYQDCCQSCVSPCVALGAIAVVAIIAIACSSGGHHHHHSHS